MMAVQAGMLLSASSLAHPRHSWPRLSAQAVPPTTSIASATPTKIPFIRIKNPRFPIVRSWTLHARHVPRNLRRLRRHLEEFRRRRDRILETKAGHGNAFGKRAQQPRRHLPVEQDEDAMVGRAAHQPAEGLLEAQPRNRIVVSGG